MQVVVNDVVPPVPADEYEAAFGDDDALFANIELPSDSALTETEKALLDNLNKKLQEIEFQTCDHCYEEGFELRVEDGKCVSCRNEKGSARWSFENKTQPGNRILTERVQNLSHWRQL